ncbi:NAD(P)-dependent alcohol dehydrogenase [Cellulomonas algicola]|uniref:NAD(P)-dependent alcohol dehydrogenase n=1 Tax=Cellulomonas algicola TaxID=2071633 RepID=UPI001C3FEB2E|nr:NAD(P)-dependent alcohol dehydrogenase [Cellulomonas algicola]
MKAVEYTEYGSPDVLRVVDVDRPEPGPDEVLVAVRAVSVNGSDWEGLTGRPAYARLGGLRRPRRRVLGSDVAGTVVAVGADVTTFAPGDDVYADLLDRLGCFAEHVCAPARSFAPLPDGMSFVEASAVPQAGVIAMRGIVDRGRVRAGQRVLVNGAGGGAGTYAVQLAVLAGAEVTAVDTAHKADHLRSLGAVRVLDHRVDDWTRPGPYDLVLDLACYRSVGAIARGVAPGGTYLVVGGAVRSLLQVLVLGPLVGLAGRKRLRVLAVPLGVRHVGPLVDLLQAGTVRTVVGRTFPLEQTADALRHHGSGHSVGKVVVTVDPT